MFMPHPKTSIHTIYSYYLSTVSVNLEGDASFSDEINLLGIGGGISNYPSSPSSILGGLRELTIVSGYFLAGGLAGTISRTLTAPFDRIKVYLIAQTDSPKVAQMAGAAVKADVTLVAQRAVWPIKECIRTLWRAGGIRSFFAGLLIWRKNSR